MTYTYKCKEHGNFTLEKGINDEHLKECPICGKEVTRVFVATDYIAKCDGFYGKSSK